MKTNKLLQLLRDNARAEAPRPIRAEVSAEVADIYVNDVIDSNWGASASALLSALNSAGGKTVNVHINSPGGDVFEARAMAAAIVGYGGRVVAHIDGVCASAATYIALACNAVHMTDGGLFMVHNSWTLAMGNKQEMLDTAALLDKIDSTIISDYCKKTGQTKDQVTAWMDATTWFTAQEAMDAGFIDAIDPNTKAEDKSAKKAQWNLSAYPNAPKAYSIDKPSIKAATDTDSAYITAMIACETECVKLSKDLLVADPMTGLREYAEECIDDCAGDIELLKTWLVSPPPDGEFEDPDDSAELTLKAIAQSQTNRNRLRLLTPI